MKIRIVNLKKFIRSVLIILLITGFISIFFSNFSLSYGETNFKTIYVEEGDTLWNIAKEQRDNNKYYNNKNIRYIIDDIKNVNSLNNSELQIGQKLEIPTL